MDDILDMLMGVDKKGEIFTLWYEITFLRMVVNKIMQLNPDLHKEMTEEVYESARNEAQDIVRGRFPNCKLDFTKPGCRGSVNQEPASPLQEDESKRKAEEALRSLRSGWFKHPEDIIEDQREGPACTPLAP